MNRLLGFPRQTRTRRWYHGWASAHVTRFSLTLWALALVVWPGGIAAQVSAVRGLVLTVPELTRSVELVVIGEIVDTRGEWNGTRQDHHHAN